MWKHVVRVIRALAIALALGSTGTASAGGSLESPNLDDTRPSASLANAVSVGIVPLRWDARCIPVSYSINTTRNPLPNPLGGPSVSVEQARSAIQASMDAWTAIPTSFIEMNITA